MLFPLVHVCYKNLQHRSTHNPIIWAWRNRAKLKFLSDILWLNDIEPLIALFIFLLCICNLFCFLWPSWMIFWGMHIYIYIDRWDLAATSLADILDLDATSVKKTHSHSPPLSFKNKLKTKLLNPCPKPLTFPQGYLCFLDFYMVSNGTRDLKQAETTTNKFAMPKGGKVAKS